MAGSIRIGGEGSGDSTPRAETPERLDEEKARKLELKKAEKLEKQIQSEKEKIKEKAEKKKQNVKKKKTLKAESLLFYDRDKLERGVPMR